MKLLIGLGNPGSQYTHTRHNLGFMIVDELARRYEAIWKHEPKLKADVTTFELAGQKTILSKPQTFMNLSGRSVQRLVQFYKLAPTDIWVIHDDLDLPFGRARLRTDGGSGGHNGLKSLIEHIGQNFVRLRLGIGQNDRATEPSESYVLQPFAENERDQLPRLITAATDLLEQKVRQNAVDNTTHDLLNERAD